VIQAKNEITTKKHGQHHDYENDALSFDTWRFETERQFSLEALREMVRKQLPASIYRCKGIVFTADSPDARFALQIVGRRTEILELDQWGSQEPHSQIVAIGAANGFDPHNLTKQFEACLDESEMVYEFMNKSNLD